MTKKIKQNKDQNLRFWDTLGKKSANIGNKVFFFFFEIWMECYQYVIMG